MEECFANSDLPLKFLGDQSLKLLSALLNPEKFIPTDDNLPRDWQGLAHLISLPAQLHQYFKTLPDSTGGTITWWYTKNESNAATLKTLHSYLVQMDRYDVIDDLEPLIAKDIQLFKQRNTKELQLTNKIQEKDKLTIDDQQSIQQYDALVLYADEEYIFADELISKLRGKGLKICTKDELLHDFLMPHVPFARLISERCRKVIAIFSSSFFNSSINEFYAEFALSHGIRNKRSFVPCLYGQCDNLPSIYQGLWILNYNRTKTVVNGFDFWQRLESCLGLPTTTPNTQKITSTPISQPIAKLQPITNVPTPQAITSQLEEISETSLSCQSSNGKQSLSDSAIGCSDNRELLSSSSLTSTVLSKIKKVFKGERKKKKIAEIAQ